MHGRDVRLGDCNEYRRCPLLVVHCESVISDFSECQHFYDQRVTTKYEQTRASMSYLYGHISIPWSVVCYKLACHEVVNLKLMTFHIHLQSHLHVHAKNFCIITQSLMQLKKSHLRLLLAVFVASKVQEVRRARCFVAALGTAHISASHIAYEARLTHDPTVWTFARSSLAMSPLSLVFTTQ
jgi:hypothetical protein